jgi:hypothetical protein
MALPAIAAGAAKGLAAARKGMAAVKGVRKAGKLGKAGEKIGKAAMRGPSPGAPTPEAEEKAPDEATNKFSAFTRPEVIMFIVAILLDIFGVICLILDIFFGVGEIPSWFSDGAGIIFIGGWMWFRSGRMEVPERAKQRAEKGLRKLFRGKYKKFFTPILGEVAPLVGAFPFWSLAVYYELTS